MRNLTLSLLFLLSLALGCGGNYGSSYSDSDSDAGIGQSEQPLSSKASGTYTYGYDLTTMKLSKWKSPGPVIGMLPGRTTIRYKLDGADACSPTGGLSWKGEIKRGFSDLSNWMSAAGYSYPFFVVEDNVNPSVIFTRTEMGGSASTATDMSQFMSVSAVDKLVKVTETLNGDYYRHDGVLIVNIDVKKIWARGGGASLDTCGAAGHGFIDVHSLLEHAGHIAALFPHGQGMYNGIQPVGPGPIEVPTENFPSWSSSTVAINFSAGDPYDAAGYPQGQLCRIGSWVSGPAGGTTYTPAAATCND